MSANIDTIRRRLLIKYPTFGSVIANLEFHENNDIPTSATNGKEILYNSNFLDVLSDKEQIFLFAHEVCHVAFDHILRSEGKDPMLWNIATDSVINALLQQDGLPLIKDGVDIPEAVNYDAEEMYNKLLEERKKNQEKKKSQDDKNKPKDVGHDTHSLWDKAIEEIKKEQRAQAGKSSQGHYQTDNKDNNGKKQYKNEKSEFSKQGEKKTFKQNKIERKKRLEDLSKELANESSHGPGKEIQREKKKLSDIGISAQLIDWRKLLRQATKYDEEWTRKNNRMKNGYFKHKVEQIPMSEVEILLDTSGSVSEKLLKNFLIECKNILYNSKVKVGCFNTEFHGFTEVKKQEDIDNMSFPIGGGTDFNVAVEAFSRRVANKIIFTDGQAPMPEKNVKRVIWVVFGNKQINPKAGKVINITGEQLRKLYGDMKTDKSDDISR